jgi:hypothetical protein
MPDQLTAVPGSYPGETWDSDKPSVTDRIFDLFDALNRLGTQEETEPERRTLRTLLCNRETLAKKLAVRDNRIVELEQIVKALLQKSRGIPDGQIAAIESVLYSKALDHA